MTSSQATSAPSPLSQSERAVSGTLSVDLLDPKDAVVASSKATERLKPGCNLLDLHLARTVVPTVSENDPVLWYRVSTGRATGTPHNTNG
jgi:hypothetical protein